MKEKYFNIAKNTAELSDFPQFKLGCAIVYKNKILNTAWNTAKTHPLQKEYNKMRFSEDSPHRLHAEIYALIPLLRSGVDWKKVEIYIYRIRKDRPQGMARPCKSCLSLIRELGIRKIHYTTDEGFATEELIY